MSSILEVAESPKAWIPVPGYPGFRLNVKYLSPADIKRLGKSCSRQELNRQTRAYEEVTDNELLAKQMTKEMIQGWDGFKADYLKDMMPVAQATLDRLNDEFDGMVPFDADNMQVVVDNTYTRSFMDLVMEAAMDLRRMRELEDAHLEKNSDASPAM